MHVVEPDQSSPLRQGREAAQELADALKEAGFILPSITGDFPAPGGGALVNLGRMSAKDARKLAIWIKAQARRS